MTTRRRATADDPAATRAEFERLLADLSANFVNLPEADQIAVLYRPFKKVDLLTDRKATQRGDVRHSFNRFSPEGKG